MVLSILKITLCFLRAHMNIIGKNAAENKKSNTQFYKVLDFRGIKFSIFSQGQIISDLNCL